MISAEHMQELVDKFDSGEFDIRDIIEHAYFGGREDAKDIGIQQAIDSALDFLWGACIKVDQQEMERYIKVMCEKKGYEV